MRPPAVAILVLGLAVSGPARAENIPDHAKIVKQTAPGVVDAATARKLVAAGVKVVDVRTPEEHAAGHVPGAVNIPYDQVGKRSAELGPPSTPLLFYCRTGRRSGMAVQSLEGKGFTRLYDLQSYDFWAQSEPKAK